MGSLIRGRKSGWKIFSNLGYYATTIGRYSEKQLSCGASLYMGGLNSIYVETDRFPNRSGEE